MQAHRTHTVLRRTGPGCECQTHLLQQAVTEILTAFYNSFSPPPQEQTHAHALSPSVLMVSAWRWLLLGASPYSKHARQ